MMGPPYCTYGLRVPASCVLYVSEAQGSWLPGPRALFVRRTRPSLGRAARTAYRGPSGDHDGQILNLVYHLERAVALLRLLTLSPNPSPNPYPNPNPNPNPNQTGGRGPVDGAADGKLVTWLGLGLANPSKLVTVIDFKGWSLRNAAPMKTSRATLRRA
eukprot:scaffold59693_cov63-Phaeocystis_antarctica.AAC.4